MKKLILLLIPILIFACLCTAFAEEESVKLGKNFDGSTVLEDELGNPKHDTVVIGASASRTYRFDTRELKDFAIDIESDKNTSVVFYPLPYYNAVTVEGEASDTCSVTGGTSKRCLYSKIMAPRVKVVVTNDEASDMTTYNFGARGAQK